MMLQRLSVALGATSRALAALATAALAVLVTFVVFQRFVTHATPHWAEELPRLVLVWAAFIGGITCCRERTHLEAGVLPYLVRSPFARACIERIGHALVMVALLTLGYAGWQLAQLTWGQTMTALGISTAFVYMALPLACVCSAFVHLAHLCAPWPKAQSSE